MAELNNDNQKHTLEEVLQQFVNLQLRGEAPDIDEFVLKYPEFEDQIRRRLRKLQKINNMFDTLVQPDESDFEDDAAKQNLVGRTIGSFEIVEMIGAGGMGVVYLARDTKLKRSVAIKSIPVALASDSTAHKRFRREAEILASLNHPNIAVIHDIIEQDHTGYLILEYVPGQTLTERIACEPLKVEEVLSIARQIAEAVSAAHKKGIIHRDLKPGNIKFTPEGTVKVLDFGLAKPSVHEGKDIEVTSTEPGRVMGTPAYMSPEQARGQSTDHRTDIWSFGCIIYQMLTGHFPFEGNTATETMAKIIEGQPDWEALPKDTPANIRTLLQRCLEKDPEKRPRDIEDVSAEISKTLSKAPISLTTKMRKTAMIISAVVIIVLSIVIVWFALRKEAHSSSRDIRLVVLPFENLGPADDEWFADSMAVEIADRLSGIQGLGVISRQSARQYKNKEKSAPQIAEELRVDYILEGTIQRERPSDPKSRIRIRSQLIRAENDTHVWTQNYDNDMSKVFSLQSEVAEQVARAMDITLVELESPVLISKPTENVEAYGYYLQGNEYFHRVYLKSNFEIAIGMYEQAIKLDPNFALAYARLSIVHDHMYWFACDRSKARIKMAEKALKKALALAPNLPDIHMAYGWYYYHCRLDYDRALKKFAIARKKRPNFSFLLEGISAVQRKQGDFEQALINYLEAIKLNPRDYRLATEIGYTYEEMRNYHQAELFFNRVISLAPDISRAYSNMASLYLRWKGDIVKAREVLKLGLKDIYSPEDPSVLFLSIQLEIFNENYPEALKMLSLRPEDVSGKYYFIPNALQCAIVYGYMNREDLAEKYYDEARNIIISKITADPNDALFHSSLGIAYAGLGLKEEAVREGLKAVDLIPVAKDFTNGMVSLEYLARIYVMVDKHNEALDKINYLLAKPGLLSISLLKLDPVWKPLYKYPRFQKLMESGK